MLRNPIFGKLFSWLPVGFLLIFCVDIYFSVPNADDYDFFVWVEKYGFTGFQKYMYLHQNGRFMASFFIACYSTLFNLFHCYWIFPLGCFIFFYLSFYRFVKFFFRYLAIKITAAENMGYAGWLALFIILLCKELSSFLFWMPGIINYQLVVSFFVFGVTGLLQYRLYKKRQWLYFSLLCFAICSGLHEMFFVLIIPGLLFHAFINVKNPAARNVAILLILAALLPFLLSYLSPGTSLRKTGMNNVNEGWLSSIFNAFSHVAFLFGYLLTIPYLYITLAIIYTAFSYHNFPRLLSFFKGIGSKYLLCGLVLQPMLIYIITFKSFASGLPARAENLLLLQAGIFLLLLAIKFGVHHNPSSSLTPAFFPALLFGLLVFLCIASPNIINGFKGIISGHIYKEISRSRLKNLTNSKGIRTLQLTGYQDELDAYYAKKYHKKMPLKLLNIAALKNIILYADIYELLPGQNNSFRYYNHIDTLKTLQLISFRDTLIYLPAKR